MALRLVLLKDAVFKGEDPRMTACKESDLESFRDVSSEAEERRQRPDEGEDPGGEDHEHRALLRHFLRRFQRVRDHHVSVVRHPGQRGDRDEAAQSTDEAVQLAHCGEGRAKSHSCTQQTPIISRFSTKKPRSKTIQSEV